jgi:hypothetical protein
MTDEEVLHHYDRMVDIFGQLPHPDHEPIRFAFFVKIYKYYHLTH